MKNSIAFFFIMSLVSSISGQQEFKEHYFNTSRTHGNMHDIVSGDFNGDGLVDHITLYDNANTIYLSLSNPWKRPSLTPIATFVPNFAFFEVADIDLDDDIDLICTNPFREEIWVWYNDGVANFRQGVWIKDLDSEAIHIGDLDDDNVGEVLIANFTGLYIYQLTNDDPILLQEIYSGSRNTAPKAIDTYDYNDDGLMDIAVAYRTQIQIYYQDQQGKFAEAKEIGINLADKLHTTDIDNDGLFDFLLYRMQGPYAYYAIQQSDGSFQLDTFPTVGRYGCGVAEFEDIDQDGDVDVLHMDNDIENGDFSIYYNNNGAFEKSVVSNRITRSNIAGVGDMDNDGLLDVFMFNVENELGPFIYENITDVTSSEDFGLENFVSIRPTLFDHYFTVDTEIPISYSIFHSSGAMISSGEAFGSKQLNTTKWPSGVYHIKLRGLKNDSEGYHQIIKQ